MRFDPPNLREIFINQQEITTLTVILSQICRTKMHVETSYVALKIVNTNSQAKRCEAYVDYKPSQFESHIIKVHSACTSILYRDPCLL